MKGPLEVKNETNCFVFHSERKTWMHSLYTFSAVPVNVCSAFDIINIKHKSDIIGIKSQITSVFFLRPPQTNATAPNWVGYT